MIKIPNFDQERKIKQAQLSHYMINRDPRKDPGQSVTWFVMDCSQGMEISGTNMKLCLMLLKTMLLKKETELQ